MRSVADRLPRDIHPWRIVGRLMVCSRCSASVDVIEIPTPTIDPTKYVCPDHWAPIVAARASMPELPPIRSST